MSDSGRHYPEDRPGFGTGSQTIGLERRKIEQGQDIVGQCEEIEAAPHVDPSTKATVRMARRWVEEVLEASGYRFTLPSES